MLYWNHQKIVLFHKPLIGFVASGRFRKVFVILEKTIPNIQKQDLQTPRKSIVIDHHLSKKGAAFSAILPINVIRPLRQ